MKEKLQEYALIAEIISALAVVAGLVFVGLEIRQSTAQAEMNTRAIETAAYQDLIGQIIDINRDVMADPVLMDLIQRGLAGEIDPMGERDSRNDAGRYFRYVVSVMRHADLACFQYQQGVISDARLASAMAIFLDQVVRTNPDFSVFGAGSPGLGECVDIAQRILEPD